MVQLHVERTVGASPEAVFDWLSDPANLTTAPFFVRAAWRADSPPVGVGALREVIVAGAWLREEITAFDPPWSYSYRVVRSFPPCDHDGGSVTLAPSGDGTHVTWVSTYSIPARGGGRLTEAITAPLFRSSFRRILASCSEALSH
ncbi:SRPBCC family protein [Mycolicibacterium sp. 018/SC-01/001]|uniref:SRPBCC family protein n=1 Tax=Mycolicibacterium sp. 018/SC-01/001 TaxID=2592069 RepID=UPI00117C2560|nr:SRPBCC family protein [Mycolicibacterium sp. 018/SC-01/001]TRW88293.1 SRPBCC family protein [Mycolicibacterium sp. 018/SC-01/001]